MIPIEILYQRALEYLEAGDYEGAQKALKTYLGENPTDAMAYNKLGVVLVKKKNIDEAKNCFGEALKYDPSLVHALNNLGNIAREAGELQIAVDYYLKAIEIDPEYSIPHNNLSVVYKQLHRYGDFLREIKTAKRLEHKKLLNPKGLTFSDWLRELWSKPRD